MSDLARLLTAQGDGGVLRFGQGTIVAWDPETAENIIDWRGLQLRNLAVIGSGRPMFLEPGDTVALLGWDSTGGRGIGVWWILGQWIIPGGTEDGSALFDTLSAREVNTERLNADEIWVDGKELSDFVGDLITEQVPESDPDPPPTGQSKLTRTYNATWSANYRSNNARNSFDERPHQGYWSSTNGNQRSLIGFSTSAINADHAGRTITRVRVRLRFAHWRLNSGGTAVIGHHGHSSAPSSFSANTDNVRSSSWPKPGTRTVTYNVGNLQDWLTGAKRGFSLGPGPSTGGTYYGRAHGADDSVPPRLEITSTG